WLAEGKMKRLLLAAAAVAVLSIGANARDDRLPTNFVGDWCFAEHTADHLAFYRRGRCLNLDNVDDWLTINPDSFAYTRCIVRRSLLARTNVATISPSSAATTI